MINRNSYLCQLMIEKRDAFTVQVHESRACIRIKIPDFYEEINVPMNICVKDTYTDRENMSG